MAKKKTRKQPLSKARIISLLKRHKKIKIAFKSSCPEFEIEAERILTHKGTSLVRYQHENEKLQMKWTRYSTSCFCIDLRDGYFGNKKDKAKQIVDVMLDYVVGNDRLDKHIAAIFVGPGFKRKVV